MRFSCVCVRCLICYLLFSGGEREGVCFILLFGRKEIMLVSYLYGDVVSVFFVWERERERTHSGKRVEIEQEGVFSPPPLYLCDVTPNKVERSFSSNVRERGKGKNERCGVAFRDRFGERRPRTIMEICAICCYIQTERTLEKGMRKLWKEHTPYFFTLSLYIYVYVCVVVRERRRKRSGGRNLGQRNSFKTFSPFFFMS